MCWMSNAAVQVIHDLWEKDIVAFNLLCQSLKTHQNFEAELELF